MTLGHAPDLKNGYITNLPVDSNMVRTNIECVLERRIKGKEREFSYLSNECRAELVGEKIFDGRFYEVCLMTTWNGILSLRHGSFNYGFNPVKNAPGRLPETACVKWKPGASSIHCDEVEVNFLSFADALDNYGKDTNNNVYFKIDWETDGIEYSLYAPCRYTNYLNSELENKKYIQPISGYIIVDLKGRFYLGYAAAYVEEDGTKTTEFILRDKISFIQTKPKSGSFFWLFNLLDKLFLKYVFVTDEFHKIVKVDGECTFFTYEKQSLTP